MAIDKDAIREHVRGILAALGDDPNREGLKETPDRVARMYEEVFEGMNYTNHEIAMMFNKSFKDDLCVGSDKKDIVLVRDIPIFSYCEHHIALFGRKLLIFGIQRFVARIVYRVIRLVSRLPVGGGFSS